MFNPLGNSSWPFMFMMFITWVSGNNYLERVTISDPFTTVEASPAVQFFYKNNYSPTTMHYSNAVFART